MKNALVTGATKGIGLAVARNLVKFFENTGTGNTYQRNPYMAIFATNALYYRGIGSGIVRILAEYPDIQLGNDDSAKEFKVTIWRTIQKNGVTIQKNGVTIQKKSNTIKRAKLLPKRNF